MPVCQTFIGMQCMSFEKIELLHYMHIQQRYFKMFVAYVFESNISSVILTAYLSVLTPPILLGVQTSNLALLIISLK